MQKLLFAVIAIIVAVGVIFTMARGTLRRVQADRAQRLFLALAQELKLQVDFSARWGELPLPIATGNLEGSPVRVESRLHRAKLPWHVRTHVEATRRDKAGPVGVIGQPERIKAPAGATELRLTDAKGRTLRVHTTDVHVLEDALDADLVQELIDLCTPGRGLVLHQDRVEYVDAPVTSDAHRAHVERVARVAAKVARRLQTRIPKAAVE